jgi:hypothetical protein
MGARTVRRTTLRLTTALLALLLAVAAPGWSTPAGACSMVADPAPDVRWDAPTIFVGRILNGTVREVVLSNGGPAYTAEVAVTLVYRGTVTRRMQVATFRMPEGTTCPPTSPPTGLFLWFDETPATAPTAPRPSPRTTWRRPPTC